MNVSRLLIVLGLIIVGVASRLLPHPPNFTSINAIALFSAFYLGSPWLSFATVISTVFLCDTILGFHSTMPAVYVSFGLMIGMGSKLKSGMSLHRIPLVCLASSLLFFLITNFGVWMAGFLYPKTVHGLAICYLEAVPFLANQILGDLAYGIIFFGLFHLFGRSLGQMRQTI